MKKFPGMYTLIVDGQEAEVNLAAGEAFHKLQRAFETGSDVGTVVRQG
jgi:hypothetical protein